MRRDIYVAYIGAKGAVLAWVGSALGPIFVLIGVIDKSWAHSLIGAAMLLVAALSIRDGLAALRAGVKTDFAAFSVVPLVLLPCGVALAFAAHAGHI